MILRKLRKEALRIIDEDFTIVDFSFASPYTYVVIEGKIGASMKVLNIERALTKLKLGTFRGFEKENKKYIIEVPEDG